MSYQILVAVDSMFKSISECSELVEFSLNGKLVQVPKGTNVAAAVLLESAVCRTTVVSNTARGPFCMMGVCFDCLVSIDGLANQQGCQTLVEPGMEVIVQRGAVEAERVDDYG